MFRNPCIYSYQIHETVRLNSSKHIFPLDFTFFKLNYIDFELGQHKKFS